MKFYAYSYFTGQNVFQNYARLIIVGILLILLIGFSALYLKNRMNIKYRDLMVILGLLIILVIGTQVGDFQKMYDTNSQAQVTKQFVQKVASDYHLSKGKVFVNSTSLKNGMLLEMNHRIYRVEFDDSLSSYNLIKAKLVTDKIVYVR